MILARIAKAIREQNWFAVVLEFVIVVAGVLLAFQATAWNESRLNRQVERDYLVDLAIDFEAICADLSERVVNYESTIVRMRHLRENVRTLRLDGTRATDDDISADLIAFTRGWVPAGQAAAYIEMQAAGEIRLIRNRDLRRRLVIYDQQTERAATAFEIIHTERLGIVPELAEFIDFDVSGATDLGDYLTIESVEIDKILTYPGTERMISVNMRFLGNAHVLLRRQLAACEVVLAQLGSAS